MGRRVEKRGFEQSVEDDADDLPDPKKAKMPALARFLPFYTLVITLS